MTSKTRQRRLSRATDPTTWATDPTTWAKDLTRPNAAGGERVLSVIEVTPDAPIAANESAQGATAAGNTVMRLAPNEPTANDNESAPRSSAAGDVDSTSTKPNATLTRCEQCGVVFTPKTRRGRFCGSSCRRRAWLERNPEKAAELAMKDKARLRASIIARGGVWVERGDDGTHSVGHSAAGRR